MRILDTAADLAEFTGIADAGVIFVPTMGALHDGHAELVRAATRLRGTQGVPTTAKIVVSIFVNPTQFNDPKDLARYPRTLGADLSICQMAGADAVFTPTPEVVYPPGQIVRTPKLPQTAISPGLEDALRPGHFAGVCQVVLRLFELVQPRWAMFGEKDWQQCRVITQMVEQEQLNVRVIPVATVREPGGLAMSSRNVFLTPQQRALAHAVPDALCAAAGERSIIAAERAMRMLLQGAGMAVEYAVVRDAATLLPTRDDAIPARSLIAVRLPSVRLIDNAPWG